MKPFAKLDALKARLDEYRPLDKAVTASLHEELVLQWTYHSNAIEGNTLTLKETKVALEGITIGGKTLREHFEAINHRDAILMVEELVEKLERGELPLEELLQAHGIQGQPARAHMLVGPHQVHGAR